MVYQPAGCPPDQRAGRAEGHSGELRGRGGPGAERTREGRHGGRASSQGQDPTAGDGTGGREGEGKGTGGEARQGSGGIIVVSGCSNGTDCFVSYWSG
jgi:hypothetical protein